VSDFATLFAASRLAPAPCRRPLGSVHAARTPPMPHAAAAALHCAAACCAALQLLRGIACGARVLMRCAAVRLLRPPSFGLGAPVPSDVRVDKENMRVYLGTSLHSCASIALAWPVARFSRCAVFSDVSGAQILRRTTFWLRANTGAHTRSADAKQRMR
jgi:hypothetical protein